MALLERSVAATADGLGRDGRAWASLFGPLVADADRLLPEVLGPVVHVPRHPIALALFGLSALFSANRLARTRFRDDAARALFGGIAAHSMVALERPLSAAFALVLGTVAHAHGWPMARGGSGALADALVAELQALGGEIVTDHRVEDLRALPAARAILLDLTPRQVAAIAGDRLPEGYRRRAPRGSARVVRVRHPPRRRSWTAGFPGAVRRPGR